MKWKVDLENLVEQTKAMLKNSNQKMAEPAARPEASSPREPVIKSALPQTSALPQNPLPQTALTQASLTQTALHQMTWSSPAREEIKQRVAGFKAHQEKLRREREEYYLATTAKTRAMLEKNIRNEKSN